MLWSNSNSVAIALHHCACDATGIDLLLQQHPTGSNNRATINWQCKISK